METKQNEMPEVVTQRIENIVEIEDGKTFTTSLIVAEIFEKEHKNVLRDIENLECSDQFNQLNFEPVGYKDAKGEMRPAYRMTRDGFSFLAMGFTGKKAAAWKEKFLEAFNAMERELLAKNGQKELEGEEKSRRARTVIMLRGFASYWAYIDKISLLTAEAKLCQQIGIKQLEDIIFLGVNDEKISNAFNFIQNSCRMPTNKTCETKATNEQLMIIRNILSACGQWKHTRNVNFDKIFQEITGIVPEKINELTTEDADKLILTAGCLLHQTYQYAQDIYTFFEEN